MKGKAEEYIEMPDLGLYHPCSPSRSGLWEACAALRSVLQVSHHFEVPACAGSMTNVEGTTVKPW